MDQYHPPASDRFLHARRRRRCRLCRLHRHLRRRGVEQVDPRRNVTDEIRRVLVPDAHQRLVALQSGQLLRLERCTMRQQELVSDAVLIDQLEAAFLHDCHDALSTA